MGMTDNDPQLNGAEEGTGVHGGASDGLPVAAPRYAPSGYARNGTPSTEEEIVTEITEITEGPRRVVRAEALTTNDDEQPPLTAILESLLFVSGEAVEAGQLAKVLGLAPEIVSAGLVQLAEDYQRGTRAAPSGPQRPLSTGDCAGGGSLCGELSGGGYDGALSSAALEILAVIAYRQPVTRVQIEAVRGVDCSGVLRSLIQRGLIEEVGRLEAVGRPILYAVTEQFMQHFGLMELGELPPLPPEDADLLHATTALAGPADAGSQ